MKKQGLQKFTNSQIPQRVPDPIYQALEVIIKGGKISLIDTLALTEEQKAKLAAILTAGYLTLAGDDREKLSENTEAILSDVSRNEIWERNHYCIMTCVDYLTRTYGKLPTVTEVAQETQLSRKTVSRHMKEYYESDAYQEKKGSLDMLREKLLVKMYDKAWDGDVKAAKLFFSVTDPDNSQTKVQNQQNNFIQINGTTISREQLSQLPQDRQKQLLDILSMVGR